jgi:hypothetical protein
MANVPKPFTQQDAYAYFEGVVAAVLATKAINLGNPTPDNMIEMYKIMLQKLRQTGDSFN